MLRGYDPGFRKDSLVVVPVDRQSDGLPSTGALFELCFDRRAPDEVSTVVAQIPEHPAPAQFGWRLTLGIDPREARRMEVGADQEQPRLDPGHLERRGADRRDVVVGAGGHRRVPDRCGVR